MSTKPPDILVVANTDNNKENEEDPNNWPRQPLDLPLFEFLGNAPFFLCP